MIMTALIFCTSMYIVCLPYLDYQMATLAQYTFGIFVSLFFIPMSRLFSESNALILEAVKDFPLLKFNE
jgi:hypothetical protein